MEPGDAKAATLADGTRLGKATVAQGRKTARVADGRAFLHWVKKNHPDEIVESVRESFRAKVLDSAKAHELPVDTATGEVIPGVDLVYGNPYVSFRGESGWEGVVAARWRELTAQVLELPEGES